MRFEPDHQAVARSAETGVWCDQTGAFIGPGIPLVERWVDDVGTVRFLPVSAHRLGKVLTQGYGEPVDIAPLLPGLARVAAALENNDLVLANIALVHLQIPPLSSLAHGQAAFEADTFLKASADDPQHPGWPRGAPDGKGGQFAPKDAAGAVGMTATATAVAPSVAPLLGSLSTEALKSLALFGLRLAIAGGGVGAFLGTLFIPSNRSLITDGTLPDRPDIKYRYDDDGRYLQLFQGGRPIFAGRVGADGIFRSDDGTPFGRVLDGSIMLDSDAVAAIAAPGRKPGTDPGLAAAAAAAATAAGAAATTQIKTVTATNSEPKLCPDPGPDKPGARPKDIAYQDFIGVLVNGEPLPPGTAVALWNPEAGKFVYFDNCRLSDGAMIEAKGTTYLQLMEKGINKFPWLGAESKMLNQAQRQRQAAGDRPIEWYFAEKPVADYMDALFKAEGLSITVVSIAPP